MKIKKNLITEGTGLIGTCLNKSLNKRYLISIIDKRYLISIIDKRVKYSRKFIY